MIKEIKQQKFSKLREKKSVNDYKVVVRNDKPKTIVAFVNECMAADKDFEPITESNALAF